MSVTLKISNGDLDLGENGQGTLISGVEKLSQDVAEVILTPYDATEDWGNRLGSVQLPYVSNWVMMEGLIKSEVAQAVQRLRRKQQTFPQLSDGERINKVKRIDVAVINGIALFFLAVEASSTYTIPLTFQTKLGHVVPPDGDLNFLKRIAGVE